MEDFKELIPIKDNIIGIEKERELVTESGIIIGSPHGVGGALNYIVDAIGPSVKEVKVGDEVALEWGKGRFFEADGKKYIIIQEKYISAVIEN